MQVDLLFIQPVPDWREEAIRQLEPDIKLYAYRFHIKGMEADDVAQEMRLHLWRKLSKYDPMKSGLRTWAQRVMRNRCTDLDRRANDMLDHEKRVFPEVDEPGHQTTSTFTLVDLSERDRAFFDLFFGE